MLAKYELREYFGQERVWVGAYESLRNLSHWHYDCELVYVKRGKATIFVGSEKYDLQEGQSIYIDSCDVHRIEAEEKSLLILFIFEHELIEYIMTNYGLKKPMLKHNYNLIEIANRLYSEMSEKKPYYAKKMGIIIIDLMIEIFRNEETCEKATEKGTYIERYRALLVDIENKYDEYTFSDAASFMGLSEHYFSEIFHKISGMTFSKYLNHVRIRKAVEMLRDEKNDKTVTEISADCGFDTIRHFNRVFKEITGFSPTEIPDDYSPQGTLVKDMSKAYNPTLEGSVLIKKVSE